MTVTLRERPPSTVLSTNRRYDDLSCPGAKGLNGCQYAVRIHFVDLHAFTDGLEQGDGQVAAKMFAEFLKPG